jgi:hypothetical protein
MPQKVIVSKSIQPGTATIAESRDDSHLTVLMAVSAFGDSTSPMFITQDKTFETETLAES